MERSAHPRPGRPAAPHRRGGGAALDAERPPLLRRHPDPDHLRNQERRSNASASARGTRTGKRKNLPRNASKGGGTLCSEESMISVQALLISLCFYVSRLWREVWRVGERRSVGRARRGEESPAPAAGVATPATT
jgi:hypothetical protein